VNNKFRERNSEKKGLKAMPVDNSGFKIRQSSVWRFLKWSRGVLKKISKLFWKIHLIVVYPLEL